MSQTIKDGVTAVTYTGGTSQTYEEVASQSAGTTYVNSTVGATSGVFETLRNTVRQGNASSGLKFRAQAVVTIPVIDAVTGDVRYAAMRIELTVDPQDHATEHVELRRRAAQVLTEAGFENLWSLGQE